MVSFREFFTETVFNTTKHSTSDQHIHNMKLGNHDVHVSFDGDNDHNYSLYYSINKKTDKSVSADIPVHQKEQIARHVGKVINNFVKEKSPNSLVFSHANEEHKDSFSKFSKAIGDAHGYKYSYDTGYHFLHKTKTVKEDVGAYGGIRDKDTAKRAIDRLKATTSSNSDDSHNPLYNKDTHHISSKVAQHDATNKKSVIDRLYSIQSKSASKRIKKSEKPYYKNVSLSTVVSNQHTVSKKGLHDKVKGIHNKNNSKLPIMVHDTETGHHLLYDGNHRAVSRKMRNFKNIRAMVVDV